MNFWLNTMMAVFALKNFIYVGESILQIQIKICVQYNLQETDISQQWWPDQARSYNCLFCVIVNTVKPV